MSDLKFLYTASLNAMLEAGCPQALAQGYLVILWSLALGGGEMRCAIALQSDEAKEKGWNIAVGYAWCKPKGQNFQTLSKIESHIFLIVTCRIGITKLWSNRTWKGSKGFQEWWGVRCVSVLKKRWDAPCCHLVPEANLTL